MWHLLHAFSLFQWSSLIPLTFTGSTQSLAVVVPRRAHAHGYRDVCRGQMAAEEVTDILWQLLHALRYLHGLAVWHRDLKSSNLLLANVNGRRIIKVSAVPA